MAAAASDKARFYMEQSVPELQEYSRKGIFSPEEITAIARKRSEFEHKINMAGAATPTDYARYATYEMNLDTLRKKRSKRLGVRSTAFSGQKKIFNVLERGVRKFQGDMGLWMQYLEFCKQETANKKLAKALTQALRLHPLKWELWVWGARHYLDAQADMTTARSYMQRGLRFCRQERKLWLQYAKLEMIYVAKVAARRKILGLDVERTAKGTDNSDDHDADMIALPDITAADINPDLKKDLESVDKSALEKLASSPAFSGAIPATIFDTAMDNFKHDPFLAESFLDLFSEFADVPCTPRLLDQATQHLKAHAELKNANIVVAICDAKMQLVGKDTSSADFPLALGTALQKLKITGSSNAEGQALLANRAVAMLLPYLQEEDTDEGLAKVLDAAIRKYSKIIHTSSPGQRGPNQSLELIKRLQSDKRVSQNLLIKYGLKPQDGV